MIRAAAALLLCAGCLAKAAAAPASDDAPVTLALDCRRAGHRVSPLIFGIGHSERSDPQRALPWELGAAAVRWGGNSASRYNWELGNAWNTGSDWFFENVDYSGRPGPAYARLIDEDRAHGLATALTVPIIGWVAKDTRSKSSPVEGPPERTSVPAPPEMIGRWAETLRARGERPQMFILDNEPMLWHETHRDVHPQPVGYDELLERTLRYGTAIRRADPDAVIAGPALWGWPAYFYSARDAVAGFARHPDRKAHGDVPLLVWYLHQIQAYEEKTGVRILDVLDVHFYPQAHGVGVGTSGDGDARTEALRVRSARGLWDPAYRDESFIDEPVRLLPRLREWVDANHPGLGISIGEYNFGGEGMVSGGLAVAEALGRFAEANLTSAFYWTAPPRGSPAFWAFRAFRNFDGEGGRFQDLFLQAVSLDRLSLFVSRDEPGKRLVVVAANARDVPARVRLRLEDCGEASQLRQFIFEGGEPRSQGVAGREATLPPQSIDVLDVSTGR